MNNSASFSDLRLLEATQVDQVPPQKKLQAHPYQSRDHSNHFTIDNGDDNEMMKDDEN
jgi:hypothetical protein